MKVTCKLFGQSTNLVHRQTPEHTRVITRRYCRYLTSITSPVILRLSNMRLCIISQLQRTWSA